MLGSQVSASAPVVLTRNNAINSQNLGLEANFSSHIAYQKDIKQNPEEISTDSQIIVEEGALLPSTGPLGVAAVNVEIFEDFSEGHVDVYVVRPGDVPSQVAQMFGITTDTILSFNDLTPSSKLKEGDVLLIPPFSGVEHTVAKGQTIQGIANLYKVDVNDVLISNDIELNSKLIVNEKLIIPGAKMVSPSKSSSTKIAVSTGVSAKNLIGKLLHPLKGKGHKTRGPSRTHKGVDIGAPTGTPIYASAAGRVIAAKTGWTGGYGNMVIIEHGGFQTLYAHMSRLGTSTGKQVAQGELIGYVGNTGRSTGPHLHIEGRGVRLPW